MTVRFVVDAAEGYSPPDSTPTFRLSRSPWDDYGFGTTFGVSGWRGEWKLIGVTKIGVRGMTSDGAYAPTRFIELPGPEFDVLDERYFSVGQESSFYEKLADEWSDVRDELLLALRDMARSPSILEQELEERVLQKSLLRAVSARTVQDQYNRLALGYRGKADFKLRYDGSKLEDRPGPEMVFTVDRGRQLPTNVHVIIGPNGTGKTTALRNIRWALDESDADMYRPSMVDISDREQVAGLVSVSFSAFDTFPEQQRSDVDQAKFRVTNIGLPWKSFKSPFASPSGDPVADKVRKEIRGCLAEREERLLRTFAILAAADQVLASYNITDREGLTNLEVDSLSSGHKIVLWTMASLVRYCEEKTLVLLDEPESHLHPPLLGAFTRALSTLMTETNGLAIIATHSPVVLQEVPKRCAWKIWSVGPISGVDRPERETFGENLGVLTREVFGLELERSNYHAMLRAAAASDEDETGRATYEEALAKLDGEVGEEARLMLRAMVRNE